MDKKGGNIMKATPQDLYDIVVAKDLTYYQKMYSLANAAERLFDPIEYLGYTQEEMDLINNQIICDLNEGYLPYRPRYIVPDYNILVEKGSAFLELDPPQDLDELLDSLLIFYTHVPSITSFPVFIGFLDELINPFLTGNDEADLKKITRFLNHIDKILTDSFTHANIGPVCSKATTLILEAVLLLDNPTPNLTFRYDKELADEKTLTLALKTGLLKSKPSFANHQYYQSENDRYAICSCYNCLPVQGGANKLTRIRLGTLARTTKSLDEFMKKLEDVVKANLSILDKTVAFIYEKSNFFNTNFLVAENFIKPERFTSMLGIVGLFEAVNHLVDANVQIEQFGFSQEADEVAHQILQKIEEVCNAHEAKYSMNNKYVMHAQVGASLDDEDSFNTPAHRLKVGEEPMVYDHIKQIAPFQQYFPSGVGDLFAFDQTWSSKPEALISLLNGALFENNMRYISLYQHNTDLIRVTGYLVKKSDVAKLDEGIQVLRDTEMFGKGNNERANVFARKVRF